MRTAIPLPIDEVRDFCRRWRILRLEVFGSVLREDFTPDSDIDFLATFAPDADIGLLDLGRAEQELSLILGRPADILSRRATERSSNWLRRESILGSAREIYAA